MCMCVFFYSTEYLLYILFFCFNHVPYLLLYMVNRAFIRYARAYSVHFVRDILLATLRVTDVLHRCFTRYDFCLRHRDF